MAFIALVCPTSFTPFTPFIFFSPLLLIELFYYQHIGMLATTLVPERSTSTVRTGVTALNATAHQDFLTLMARCAKVVKERNGFLQIINLML